MSNGDTNDLDWKERLRARGEARKQADCPDEEEIRMLAVGLIPAPESQRLLAHAAGCDWCGATLREAMEDLAEPPTEEELSFAENSRLAHPVHRRAFAERLAGVAPPPKRIFYKWMVPAGLAAAAAAFVVAVGPWLRNPVAETQGLIARAYTEHREMDMRMAGAAYGPRRASRAVEMSRLDKPAELLEAEARVGRGISAHPADPEWLQLVGRVDLLEGKEDAAIEELERAHASRPDDAYILSDLGIAYFQKAQKAKDPKLFAQAFEYLSQGVRLKPKDASLVFNRAVAAERIFAFHEAQDAWEAYLRIDSTSGWAAEARQRLEDVKKNSNSNEPTAQPPPPKR